MTIHFQGGFNHLIFDHLFTNKLIEHLLFLGTVRQLKQKTKQMELFPVFTDFQLGRLTMKKLSQQITVVLWQGRESLNLLF